MTTEGDKLLLKAIHRTAQLIRFPHFSVRTQVHAENLPENDVARGRPGCGISRAAGAHSDEDQQQPFAQQACFA
eukprot:6212182-Pleurochrysis_carterae.AAC.2